MTDWGVVITEEGRCAFASSLLSRDEADALARKLGGGAQVVDAATLRVLRSMMFERKGSRQ